MCPCLPGSALASRICSLLRTAGDSRALPDGRHVHDWLIRSGHVANTHIANSLIEMYSHCGSTQEARSVFDRNPNRNLYSWNVLIKAYGLNGLVEDAWCVFYDMPLRDVISWTTLISLCAQHGHASKALHLYHQMHVEGFHPNKITFIGALNACASMRSHPDGLVLHVNVVEVGCDNDVVIGTTLIKMYGECGNSHLAWNVFGNMPCRDVVTWNAMIAVFVQDGSHSNAMRAFRMAPERNTASWNTMIGAYMQSGNAKMALETFDEMDREGAKPSVITFVCALNACASLASLEDGQIIHMQLVKLGAEGGVEIQNALITMYGKCKSIREARSVFEEMSSVDVISWTAIIVACNENGQAKEALGFFHAMQRKGVQADEVTFLCSLDTCAMLSVLREGQRMENTIIKLGLEDRWMVKTALIDMYGKCGSLQEARYTFCSSPRSNIATWNALMTTLAHNGLVEEIINLLHETRQHDVKPNQVTFSCLLTACSHAGWVDKISYVFLSIHKAHGVAYTEDHYLCLVDLVARAGQLEQAEILIKCFPFENDEGLAWQCLLAACKTHNDVERAVEVANRGFDIDPENVSLYTLLSNIQCCEQSGK
eukprot:c13902_g1_i1 orf=406-2199(-)